MSATIIDGSGVAAEIFRDTAHRAAQFERSVGRKPCLATVLIGDDPASQTYVRMKANRCRTTGLDSRQSHLGNHTTTDDAVRLVQALAHDDTVDGIRAFAPKSGHAI